MAGTQEHRKIRVAVVGDIFADVVASGVDKLPNWGTDTACPQPIGVQAGGGSLNTAVHLKVLLGDAGEVALHSVQVDDDFGRIIAQRLADAGVQSCGPKYSAGDGPGGAGTAVCIVISGAHDRCFISHYGAAGQFAPAHIDEARLHAAASHLHVGGYYNLHSMMRPLLASACHSTGEGAGACGGKGEHGAALKTNAVGRLLERARAAGLSISLDTAYDSTGTWNWHGTPHRAGLSDVLPHVDVFLPSIDEAREIFSAYKRSCRIITENGHQNDTMQEATTEHWQWLIQTVGVPLLVVTDGANGARAYFNCLHDKNYCHCPEEVQCLEQCVVPLDHSEIRDPTGAGDAFNAGFLRGWLAAGAHSGKVRAIAEGLKWGCLLGAHAVTRVGGCAEPPDEISLRSFAEQHAYDMS